MNQDVILPVAVATLDNLDGAFGWVGTCHDCQLQAPFSDALVPLRVRLHARGLALDHAANRPCIPFAAGGYVPRGPTTAAASR